MILAADVKQIASMKYFDNKLHVSVNTCVSGFINTHVKFEIHNSYTGTLIFIISAFCNKFNQLCCQTLKNLN